MTTSSAASINPPSLMSTTAAPSSSSSSSFSSWPPESLTINTEGIIDKCEEIEVTGNDSLSSQPYVLVVEMAALLYSGELVHARHLWRRWKDSPFFDTVVGGAAASGGEQKQQDDNDINYKLIFEQWWNVGKCMMNMDCSSNNATSNVWECLKVCSEEHPTFLKNYAREVTESFRMGMLSEFAPQLKCIPNFLPNYLGFTTEAELHTYLQEQQWTLVNGIWIAPPHVTAKASSQQQQQMSSASTSKQQATADLTQIVSFLESAKLNA